MRQAASPSKETQQQPFTNQVAPEHLFQDCYWGQARELLLHLALYTNKTVVLTGPTGSGKTALLRSFMHQVAFFRICVINGHTPWTVSTLEKKIAEHIDLDSLRQSYKQQIHPYILLIDDADLLSHSARLMVLKIAAQYRLYGLKLILAGKSSLALKLEKELCEMVREDIHTIEVEPFSEQETEHYILRQLQTFQLDAPVLLHKRMLRKIYRASEGRPGKINTLVQQILQETPHSMSQTYLPISLFWPSVLLALLILIGLLGWGVMHLSADLEREPLLVSPQASILESAPLPSVPVTEENIAEPPPKPVKTVSPPSNEPPQTESVEYTLQILAGKREDGIKDFIKHHQLGKQTFYYQTERYDAPWFVLIYGKFSSRQAAVTASQELQQRIPGLQPWIRRYAHVEAAME